MSSRTRNGTITVINKENPINNNNNDNDDNTDYNTDYKAEVIIVTKIQLGLLEKSQCVFHYEYNNETLYDAVVLTTEPIPKSNIQSLLQTLLSSP